MKKLPHKLQQKLAQRDANNALRTLGLPNGLVDFSSNDYLGFSNSKTIFNCTHQLLIDDNVTKNGSSGSRLLSGNHKLYTQVETMLCKFHKAEAALVFNSGYDANLGFFSSVPQRGDVIVYDEFIHASIRDGIKMSHAKAYKFRHNDLEHLDEILRRVQRDSSQEIYVVSESVFSMDGDAPDLELLCKLCKKQNAHLIIDEAHAVGVIGNSGEGHIQELDLQDTMFARLVTFGKGIGAHGAAILGSTELKQYLINFSRPFIYTTALPPHALATIHCAYKELSSTKAVQQLKDNILFFNSEIIKNNLQQHFIESHSAIHSCVIPENKKVKSISKQLQDKGFDVKPILSPTVPKGQERLRFCLHAFNSSKEIEEVLKLLATFV